MFEHVNRLANTDIAILLVEQRAREALSVSHWAYLMVSGRVSESAPEFLQRPDIGDIFLGRVVDATASIQHSPEVGRELQHPIDGQ